MGVGGRRDLRVSSVPDSLTPSPWYGCSMVSMRIMWERLELQLKVWRVADEDKGIHISSTRSAQP